MTIYALILARGGSKGIPHKNIVPLMGRPLIEYSIEVGLQSHFIQKTFVSTNSKEIHEISIKAGALAPFLRPEEISGDLATDLEGFLHFLNYLKESEQSIPDVLVHLRPTSPLRTVETVDRAISLLLKHPNVDCVRSVAEAGKHPFKMWSIQSNGELLPFMKSDQPEAMNGPRQLLPKVYEQTGVVDVIRTESLLKNHSMTGQRIYPIISPESENIDIDTPMDLKYAEFLLSQS